MATNFMKTSLQAAVVAGLAAGSFGAQAALQSVPGEAQLVPMVYQNLSSVGPTVEYWDTVVRVEMPNSLGKDTVIQITAPQTTPTSTPSIESIGQATTPRAGAANVGEVKLHWYFLDESSNHVINGNFAPTLDDLWTWDAAANIPANKTGYLVIVNESATNGGKANDAFFADAILLHRNAAFDRVARATSIPTYAMADGVDVTTYPTPSNNVIESQLFTTAPKFPVASPIHSGIRTGAAGIANNIRLFDMALADREYFDNLLVVWNDRNGLTQTAVEFDEDEHGCSTTINLPQQLNILYVPSFNHINAQATPTIPARLAFVDNYSTSGAATGFNPYTALCQNIAENSEDHTNDGLYDDSGFLKIYVNEIPQTAAPLVTYGAYASLAAFTLPVWDDTDPDVTHVVGLNAILAKDRGFFDAR